MGSKKETTNDEIILKQTLEENAKLRYEFELKAAKKAGFKEGEDKSKNDIVKNMRELGYEFEKISQVTGRSMRQIRNAYKPVPMSPEDKYIYDVYGLGYEDDLTRAKKEGRSEGEIKGRNDVIMNMYNLGYKSEEISQVTQKSVTEVEKIFKETHEALMKNKDTVIVKIIPHDSCHDSLLVRELNEIQRRQEELERAKEDGYDEGEIETKTKIIKNMLLAEFKFEDIEQLTDTSITEIIAIKNNLKI